MNAIPTQAVQFAGFVLVHCALIVDANRNGELVCPFAVVETEGDRLVIEFEADTQEESVKKGMASLDDWKPVANGWAFGREGLYRSGESGVDVMVVTVWVAGMAVPASVIQKFGRDGENALYLIGAPELLLHADQAARQVESWDRAALIEGIALHPHGARWAQWLPQ